MNQRASAAAPGRRKNDRDSTTDRCNAQPSRCPYAPSILARSSSLATFAMDNPVFYSSRTTGCTHPPTTSGRDFNNASTEHIFSLLGRSTELSRCEIRATLNSSLCWRAFCENIVWELFRCPMRAKQRALDTTQDCDMELLLRMRNADGVRLSWKGV